MSYLIQPARPLPLGWRPGPVDPRDEPLTPHVERLAVPRITGQQTWDNPLRLDQGREGACVGFGWTGFLNAKPMVHRLHSSWATNLYHQITENDEWAGDWRTGQEGTSVRSGAKMVQQKGYINNFAFTETVQEMVTWLLNVGPIVVGVAWYSQMDNPSAQNGWRCEASGYVRGGHCVVVNKVVWGVTGEPNRMGFDNSWGLQWGFQGGAWLYEPDCNHLFVDDPDGVACTAVEERRAA